MDFGKFGEGSGKIFYVRTPALSREAPRSVPMRGGPAPPSVLDATSQTSLLNLPWEGRSPSEEASRMASVFWHCSFWRRLGSLFRIVSHFFRFLGASSIILHLFSDFCAQNGPKNGSWEGWGKLFGGFGEGFGGIWARFCERFGKMFEEVTMDKRSSLEPFCGTS